MAGDDTTKLVATKAAAALHQRVTDKMAALQATEKKVIEAHASMHAITLLLKEEQASAAALEVEAVAAALQLALTIASPSASPPPSSKSGATIVAMLHVQACGVQNIRSLVSTILHPFSTGYARWRDLVLLTLLFLPLLCPIPLAMTARVKDSVTPQFQEDGIEASIRVPRMFKSHV
jgi:hypothetical protein